MEVLTVSCFVVFSNNQVVELILRQIKLHMILEDTARYAGLLLAPAEGFGLWLIMLFWPIFGNFWCPVVTLVTFSSNLSTFKRNPPPKNIPKNSNNFKKSKNPTESKKVEKIPKIQKHP